MKKLLILSLSFILCACNSNRLSDGHHSIKENAVGLYIYNNSSDLPADSLMVYENDFEKSLELYKSTELLDKEVQGLIHLSVFRANGVKFSVIVDTSTVKVFKFENNKFNKILTFKSLIGVQHVEIKKVDFNSDDYKDLIIDIPSGGSYGTASICLFYDPKTKSFIGNDAFDFTYIELDFKNKQLISYRSLSSEKYAIQNFAFKLTERTIYLGKTTNIEKLQNKSEVSKYDFSGRLIQKDTI